MRCLLVGNSLLPEVYLVRCVKQSRRKRFHQTWFHTEDVTRQTVCFSWLQLIADEVSVCDKIFSLGEVQACDWIIYGLAIADQSV